MATDDDEMDTVFSANESYERDVTSAHPQLFDQWSEGLHRRLRHLPHAIWRLWLTNQAISPEGQYLFVVEAALLFHWRPHERLPVGVVATQFPITGTEVPAAVPLTQI